MTCPEFLSALSSRHIRTAPATDGRQIELTNAALRGRRFALLPHSLIEFYAYAGGANLNNAYIFGPTETSYHRSFVVPDIVTVNNDMGPLGLASGMTIFGRNDLFWFAYDAFGVFYMLDNLTLRPLRRYEDIQRAIMDCLIAGKI